MSNILTSDIVSGLQNVSQSNPALPQTGVSITKTTSGVQTILAAVDYDRLIFCVFAEVIEDYDDHTGSKSSWTLGDTDDPNKWTELINIQSSSAGQQDGFGPDNVIVQPMGTSCILAANKAIIVTCTPAVGDGTGGCKIVAIAVHAP